MHKKLYSRLTSKQWSNIVGCKTRLFFSPGKTFISGPICSSNPRILLFEFLKRERSEKYPEKEKKMERSFT